MEKEWSIGTTIIIFLLAAIAGKLGVFDQMFSATALFWGVLIVVGVVLIWLVLQGLVKLLDCVWSKQPEDGNPEEAITFVAEYADGSRGFFEILRRERGVAHEIVVELKKAGRLKAGKIVRLYEM